MPKKKKLRAFGNSEKRHLPRFLSATSPRRTNRRSDVLPVYTKQRNTRTRTVALSASSPAHGPIDFDQRWPPLSAISPALAISPPRRLALDSPASCAATLPIYAPLWRSVRSGRQPPRSRQRPPPLHLPWNSTCSPSRPTAATHRRRHRQPRVGIVGFGNFGQFIAGGVQR